MRLSAAGITRPNYTFTIVKGRKQPFGKVLVAAERQPVLLRARPGNVIGTPPVTSFAAYADLCPGFRITILRRVVISAKPRRVAFGAHKVPILVELGPMQDIVVANVLVRIEMEPALSALFLRPAIPRN